MTTQPQRNLIFQKLDYIPTPEQAKIHDSDERIKLVAGGERSGKSYCSSMELMARLWFGKLFWLVAADYERTKAEFLYICESLDKLDIPFHATKNVDPGEIDIQGGFRVATKSSKDPRKIAMEAPDGIVACEASQLDYETFLRLRGRIAEKRGWLLMSGTFESSLGWYPELYSKWLAPNTEDARSFSLPTWSNTIIFPGGRQDPEILALEAGSSEEWFLERFGGVPCPPKGRVFNEFSNEVHTGVGGLFEFDPLLNAELWVDPGVAHAYAVEVVQKKGEEVYVIDEVYEKGLVTSDIITIVRQKPWWNRVIGGAIDVAALQRQAMPAVSEVWLNESGIPLRSQKIRIEDGTERFKACLKVNPITGQPLIHINAKCRGLISELGGCPNPIDNQTRVYKWKTDREGNIIGDVPDDKDNDACKAVSYGLIDMLGYTTAQRRAKIKFF